MTDDEIKAKVIETQEAWIKDSIAPEVTAELTPTISCVMCGKIATYFEHDHAVAEGHIYSKLGLNEFQISKYCEFCFDSITGEDDKHEPNYGDIWSSND